MVGIGFGRYDTAEPCSPELVRPVEIAWDHTWQGSGVTARQPASMALHDSLFSTILSGDRDETEELYLAGFYPLGLFIGRIRK